MEGSVRDNLPDQAGCLPKEAVLNSLKEAYWTDTSGNCIALCNTDCTTLPLRVSAMTSLPNAPYAADMHFWRWHALIGVQNPHTLPSHLH